MRKLILKMSISVDGFVGGPNGGKGLALFGALSKRLDLALVSSTPFRAGAIARVYRPA